MDRKKFIERINSALISLLSNYAAIAFGIGVFEDNAKAFMSGAVSVICIFIIAGQERE